MGSKLINFYVQPFPEMRVIGKSVRGREDFCLEDSTLTDLWDSMEKDGSLAILLALPERVTQSADTVGWMGDFQPGDEEYTYLAGVLVQPNTPVPEGFVSRDIPACSMSVGWIQGNDSAEGGDMMASASGHMSKARKDRGYEYDGSNGFFEIEYYSEERFRGPKERGEPVILDFYSPCKKVKETS